MRKGLTLIELIVYITIFAVAFGAIVLFALNILEDATKSRSRQEVQQNARFVMRRIKQTVRAADDLNAGASTFGSHPGVLSLAMDDAGKNPTIFDFASDAVRIKEGAGLALPLTSSRVKVTNLVFRDHSVTNRVKVIRIELTVEHINPENQNQYDVSVTLRGTAVLRQQED